MPSDGRQSSSEPRCDDPASDPIQEGEGLRSSYNFSQPPGPGCRNDPEGPADGPESPGGGSQSDSMVQELTRENEELRLRIEELEGELGLSESRLRDLARDKRKLEENRMDLEDTIRHLHRQNESLAGIDVGGIVGSFLEFSSGVCNAVLDNDDIEKVRDIVGVRLDQLSKSVSSRGMTLRAHRRGDALTERCVVEAIEVPTCDRSRDWTVKSSNGFGFSFGNANVQDIAERVSVYVYDAEGVRAESARAPSTYGIEVQRGGRDCVFNMIYKDTPFEDGRRIVGKSDKLFAPTSNSVPYVTFRVYESDSRRGDGFDGDYFKMGDEKTLNLIGVQIQIPPEYRDRAREYLMKPTMYLDRKGALGFEVTDESGKKLVCVNMTTAGRLSCRAWRYTASAHQGNN